MGWTFWKTVFWSGMSGKHSIYVYHFQVSCFTIKKWLAGPKLDNGIMEIWESVYTWDGTKYKMNDWMIGKTKVAYHWADSRLGGTGSKKEERLSGDKVSKGQMIEEGEEKARGRDGAEKWRQDTKWHFDFIAVWLCVDWLFDLWNKHSFNKSVMQIFSSTW